MKDYIGTKKIKAQPMTKGEYNNYRGWITPENEDPNEAGYLVEYVDGGKPNHDKHEGYISWSPMFVFETSYKSSGELSFGHALVLAQEGFKIARKGWNGKNMFVAYMPALNLPSYNTQEPGPKVNDRTAKYIGKDTPLNSLPYFAMFTAQGNWQPGWLASQSDMLANDWCIVE